MLWIEPKVHYYLPGLNSWPGVGCIVIRVQVSKFFVCTPPPGREFLNDRNIACRHTSHNNMLVSVGFFNPRRRNYLLHVFWGSFCLLTPHFVSCRYSDRSQIWLNIGICARVGIGVYAYSFDNYCAASVILRTGMLQPAICQSIFHIELLCVFPTMAVPGSGVASYEALGHAPPLKFQIIFEN